jgi:AcrR family transcriptional regulator
MRARVVKDADERRAELLGTAMSLFEENGYEDTSVQDITEAVGVAKGTFYHYFDSKDELLVELADLQAEEVFARVEEAAAGLEGDPVAEMRVLIGLHMRWKIEDAADITMAWLRVMYRNENRDLRDRLITGYVDRLRPRFAELIAEGAGLGLFQVDDPDATADVLAAMYRGIFDHLAELLLGAEGHPDHVGEVLTHLHAVDTAMERVLGMEAGSFRLYDYEFLAGALGDLAEEFDDPTHSQGGEPR